MSLDARRRTRRRANASAVRPAHARRGRRCSVGATTRSRLGACSASSVSALGESSRRCDEESSSSQQAASSSSQQPAASSKQQAAAASSKRQQQAAASCSSKQQQAVAASSSEQQQQAAASSSSKQQQAAAASSSTSSKQQQQAAASSSKQHDDVGRQEARRPERLTPISTARRLRRCPYDGDSSLIGSLSVVRWRRHRTIKTRPE